MRMSRIYAMIYAMVEAKRIWQFVSACHRLQVLLLCIACQVLLSLLIT